MRQYAEEWCTPPRSDKAYQWWPKPPVHREETGTTSMVPPSRHEMATIAHLPAAITTAARPPMVGHGAILSAYGTILGQSGALSRGVLVVAHDHADSLVAEADRLIGHQGQWNGLGPGRAARSSCNGHRPSWSGAAWTCTPE